MRALLGEMAQLLVDGQRVQPMRAGCAGFQFLYRDLDAALAQLFPARSVRLAPAEIMYDSNCPVCDMEMGRYCRSAVRARLLWRFDDVADRTELMSCYRLDLQTARKRVYVLNDAGRMLSGIDALTSIWGALPRWRVLARIVQLPVVGALTAAFYDLILAPIIWRWNQRRRSAVGSPLMRA
jgi:predicted DCC family thiol-disulfide oxidoreductase YuxK